MRSCLLLSVAGLLLLLISGCTTISRFDQYAYAQSTSIKVDALNIMDSATADYQIHKPEITRVMTLINKAYEYEKHRQKNSITVKMWDLVKDTSGHLFSGYIMQWKREGKLNPLFIQDAKTLVAQAFDDIAQLESSKIRSRQGSN